MKPPDLWMYVVYPIPGHPDGPFLVKLGHLTDVDTMWFAWRLVELRGAVYAELTRERGFYCEGMEKDFPGAIDVWGEEIAPEDEPIRRALLATQGTLQ